MSKVTYRVKNWSKYNKSLCRRGDVTIWIDEDSISSWFAAQSSAKQGAQRIYSNTAIQCALSIRAIFHLPLRQTHGFLSSIFKSMGLDLPIPCYSTMSRRTSNLEVVLPRSSGPTHIAVDSTGLKIYGEGEWKVRTHGISKRRTWRKLHIAINTDNHEITAAVVTTNDVHDSHVFADLVNDESTAESVYADGAYDTQDCYETLERMTANAVIPPRKNAKIKKYGNCKSPPLARDENIREIRSTGLKKWKQNSSYHTRSLVETAMGRIKGIFGAKLRSTTFDNQASEAILRCQILNQMTQLGMPISEAV